MIKHDLSDLGWLELSLLKTYLVSRGNSSIVFFKWKRLVVYPIYYPDLKLIQFYWNRVSFASFSRCWQMLSKALTQIEMDG